MGAAIWIASLGGSSATSAPPQPAPPPEQIQAWIEELGSDRFRTRRRARRSLEEVGLPAFDQLLAARDHPDAEIAATARTLTLDPDIDWSRPTDSTDVIELLGNYRDEDIAERRQTIGRLRRLPVEQSASALLRLARYESDESLARTAAISFLESADPSRPGPQRDWLIAVMDRELPPGPSRLAHWRWLDARRDDLRGGGVVPKLWSTMLEDQRADLDHADAPAAAELLQVAQIIATQWPAAAQRSPVDFLLDHLELLSPQTHSIAELAAWAIDHDLAALVLPMGQRYAGLLEQSTGWRYLVAEAARELGDEALVTETLAQIRARHPLLSPTSGDLPIDPAIAGRLARVRFGIGLQLQTRGRFEWAIQEYRWIVDSLPIESRDRADATLQLAMLNIELERFGDVVDQLTPLIARLDDDDQLSEDLLQHAIPSFQLRSLLDFSRGQVADAQGRNDEAADAYVRALAADSQNIDILIAMYRLPGDDDWRRRVMATLQQNIADAEQNIHNAPIARQFGGGKAALAKALNHYAWLVSNTEGDTFLALQYSKRSLRLRPGSAAEMDTCARCYYAIGNLSEAIAMQAEAVRLEPHSPPLLRQLAFFKAQAAARP